MYDYRVTEVLRVVDGDTIDLRLDLGFYLSAALRFRLLGVNTPELRDPDPTRREMAYRAKDFVTAWFDDAFGHGGVVIASTRKADSFGRWLADILCPTFTTDQNLSRALIDAELGDPA